MPGRVVHGRGTPHDSVTQDWKATVEASTKGIFRKRHGWRYRLWSKYVVEWHSEYLSGWHADRGDCAADATHHLDRIEHWDASYADVPELV